MAVGLVLLGYLHGSRVQTVCAFAALLALSWLVGSSVNRRHPHG